MKKDRLTIFTTALIFLVFIFGTNLITTTEAREEAKNKLEQVVDKSYTDENKLDIDVLKDNIERDIDNSKVINKDTPQFPVQTIVDGHEFEVTENGDVETNTKIENNLQSNETNTIDNTQTNETDKEGQITDNPKEVLDNDINTIVKYQDDEKTDKGITISTTKDGTVTISGKSTEKLFIKISNNIQISDNVASFEKWKEEDGTIIKQGKSIIETVTILENTVKTGQVNVVLRTEKNESYGILKLIEKQTEYIDTLNENIIANYIYIDKGIQIDKIKFKVEIKEKQTDDNPIVAQEENTI